MLSHHRHVILLALSRSEILHWLRVAGIALSEFGHKVAVEHCLSHLYLLILIIHLIRTIAAGAEATNSSLVEHLILVALATIYVGEHVMDP